MDAVVFPPPPAPFLDNDFDFGDFTFASAPAPPADPQPVTFAAFDGDWGDFVTSPLGSNPEAASSAPPTPPTATSTASWEKPWSPLPLSLFGADDQEEEGPAAPPPPAMAHERAPSFTSSGSRPADLKDLIAGLYGSQPPSAASCADAGVRQEAEDDDGFGDDGWEFKAATPEPAAVARSAHGDGIGKIEVTKDTSVAIELYKHSVSTLQTLELASSAERCDYVHAWYIMLLSCAEEMQHGGALWQESCHANVCDQVISEGGLWFIALGEIYRVAQILYVSLQYFKPWVLADPGILSKMLASMESCSNAWASGLQTALTLVAESSRLDASVAKALMESIKTINELEVSNLQNILPNNKMVCRLTLLPSSLVQGMKMIMWNGDHYFVKVVNLWVNRISPDPPKFCLSQTPAPSTNNAAVLARHVEWAVKLVTSSDESIRSFLN